MIILVYYNQITYLFLDFWAHMEPQKKDIVHTQHNNLCTQDIRSISRSHMLFQDNNLCPQGDNIVEKDNNLCTQVLFLCKSSSNPGVEVTNYIYCHYCKCPGGLDTPSKKRMDTYIHLTIIIPCIIIGDK